MNGLLRITLSEIQAYCQLMAYDFEQRSDFLFYVERLDNEFMLHVEKLREEEEKKKPKPQERPPRRR